jgi:hypothetical protein
MKTISKIVEGYTIPDRTVYVYISNDGKEFSDKNACEKYDLYLAERDVCNGIKRMNIKTLDGSRLTNYECINWMYISNADELALIKKWCGYGSGDYLLVNDSNGRDNELHLGDWVSFYHEEDPDRRGTYYVYTLDYFKETLLLTLQEIDGRISEVK